MSELDPTIDRPIHDEFPEWFFEPAQVGWTAARIAGSGRIHVVGAPTIYELRLKLREIRDR